MTAIEEEILAAIREVTARHRGEREAAVADVICSAYELRGFRYAADIAVAMDEWHERAEFFGRTESD